MFYITVLHFLNYSSFFFFLRGGLPFGDSLWLFYIFCFILFVVYIACSFWPLVILDFMIVLYCHCYYFRVICMYVVFFQFCDCFCLFLVISASFWSLCGPASCIQWAFTYPMTYHLLFLEDLRALQISNIAPLFTTIL